MALIKKYQKRRLGKLIIDIIKGLAIDLNNSGTAIRFITVDAYKDKVGFYERTGFIINNTQQQSKDTVSMRHDIYGEII